MKVKLLLLMLLPFVCASCASKIPLTKNYFSSEKRVGIIQIETPINNYREGSQGLLDIAVTQGDKYAKALQIADKNLKATERIYNGYIDHYTDKGKELIVIDTIIDFERLNTFSKPSGTKKKYYKYNINFLKDQYNIDELLLVETHYGLLISYYGFIEIGRFGHCQIFSQIIDLNDNSLLFKGKTAVNNPINGNWNAPPDYDNLVYSIERAIKSVIRNEKAKLQ
jgi:hypothetical protein